MPTDQMMNKVTTYDLPLNGLALMIPNRSVQLMMVNRPGMTLPVFNGQTMLRVEYAWSAGKHAMADDWILDQASHGLSPHTAILLQLGQFHPYITLPLYFRSLYTLLYQKL